jgi:hypothetical protein
VLIAYLFFVAALAATDVGQVGLDTHPAERSVAPSLRHYECPALVRRALLFFAALAAVGVRQVGLDTHPAERSVAPSLRCLRVPCHLMARSLVLNGVLVLTVAVRAGRKPLSE